MCGIVGFTGNHQAAPILLYGLSSLNTEVMIQPESRWRAGQRAGQRMEQEPWKWLRQKAA